MPDGNRGGLRSFFRSKISDTDTKLYRTSGTSAVEFESMGEGVENTTHFGAYLGGVNNLNPGTAAS